MPLYFSPSILAFYDDAIHDTMPDDVRHVTMADHARLMQGQADGQQIVADIDGAPVLTAYPAPSADQLLANMRAKRDRLLRDCDFTQIPDAPIAAADRAAWQAYRQALRDLTETTADLSAIIWPTPPAA